MVDVGDADGDFEGSSVTGLRVGSAVDKLVVGSTSTNGDLEGIGDDGDGVV